MTATLDLGQFVDADTVRFERDYPHPVERVWAALTDPAQLATWWVNFTTLELAPGGRYEIAAAGGNAFRGRLTEYEPLKVINLSGVTRFELTPTPTGCRMTVTIKRWPKGWSPTELAGLHAKFEQLERLLAGMTPEEVWAARTWRHVYPAYEWLVRENVTGGAAVTRRVHFAEGSAEPIATSAGALAEVGALLAARRGMLVELEGHCDDLCADDEAVGLAQRRIEAVRRALEANGVAPERMLNLGGGNFHQLVPSDTEEGRAFNRRVELRPVY